MKKIIFLMTLSLGMILPTIAQNIPSYVSKNGLIGWWPFNGNANDESGNGNNGTVNGATLTTDRNGKANSAYSFTDNSQMINVGKNINPNQFTLSAWVYSIGSNGLYQTIISQRGLPECSNVWATGFDLWWNSSEELTSVLSDGTNNWPSVSFKAPNYNKWAFITTSFDGSLVRLYIDGKFVASQTITKYFNVCNTYTIIGNRNKDFANNFYFNGKVDDVTIHNRALTQEEITSLYTGTAPSAGLSTTKVFVDAPATVKQNETLELSISTEALNTADNVIAFQTDFSYDTTRYTYEGNNVVGTLNSNGTVDVNTAKKGLIKFGYISQTALSGAGSLVKLKFKANDKVGQGIFSMSNFLFNTTNITSLKSDTVNTIDGVPPTAKVTYSVNPARKGDSLLITVKFSEKMAVSPVPQINLTGQNTLSNSNLTKVNDTTYTYWWVVEKGNGLVNVNFATGKDLAGNGIVATPTQNPTFTVLPTLFGDIDTNKFVQAYDAALALQYSVGLNPLPSMDPLPWSNWRLAVANVDTVGSVTANDASLILQHSIGKISSFPADAKKRGGDVPTANVTVNIENNQLVFRTTGTLYGFNVFFKDNFNAFGQPTVNDKNAIVATNINTNNYNVGLASTTPFAENEPFLVIPIISNTEVSGTMDVVVNTQEKALAYGRSLGINEETKSLITAYPNPTKDVVTVTNAQGKTLRVLDLQGRVVASQAVVSNNHEVSLKSIGAKGTYILHIIDGNGVSIKENKIVLE